MRFVVAAESVLVVALLGTAARAQQVQELPTVTVTTTQPKATKKATSKAPSGPQAPPSSASSEEEASALEFAPADELDPRAAKIGVAQAASQGLVTASELAARPVYRTGELFEAVPGLIVTQHSGEGKANQYFLRGFNLDHGTDLAITIDGMPVNMRTHGHGQGYADTNFIIPEIVRGLAFRKGPYFASEGDFASAGAIHLDVFDMPKPSFAKVEIGEFGHRRAVAAASAPVGVDGTLMVAGEIARFDGPWENPNDVHRLNGVVRYSNGSYNNGFALTAMAYEGHWNATDQIPLYAVESGILNRFGAIDPTDGGTSHRYSLSGRWHATDSDSATRVNAYLVKSDLALFNNFTYFLNDPANGDQFQQADDRVLVGGSASKTFFSSVADGVKSATTIGFDTRYDDIDVGLYNTKERKRLSTVREDSVREASAGVFVENTLRWTDWLRTTVGLRGDLFHVDVSSDRIENSGDETDAILSPKAGLVLGPWASTELYLNAGTGFHSNDARGTVTTIDPGSTPPQPVDPAPLLVRSEGAEVGIRTQPTRGITSTLSAFLLDFDSEIVFVGDAGTTEASRPSRRIGAEFTLQAELLPWLFLDLDAAYTRARFKDHSPDGRRIPGAIEGVITAGLSFQDVWGGFFGGINVRYFGPRPLIEDNSVRSESSTPVSARLGYKFGDGLIVQVDAYNLFDETASQIDYFYESSFPSGASAVEDIHFHPLEPRSFRLAITKEW
ncbi:TonB-dependent receptor [Hyphomicrobium sp.]|uniref:TonB-dependent receptor n=1 Tax=Hyphomicrobium sp. TaxID=82 RepID=UPI0025BF8821|nr:TonB-dependent receptor [Hyphomicrobium sp.]MCC7253176.1 TonB-dependent receptor [Hyphomicrobium sp.]